MNTKGLILAGGNGSRLSPLTTSINKHLLPVYDKPMIYYPLSTLMLCGIREIAIVTNKQHVIDFQNLLGDGSRFGVEIHYLIQDQPKGVPHGLLAAETFIYGNKCVMILGDNIFVGAGLGSTLKNNLGKIGATIFGVNVKNPSDYGVVELNKDGRIVNMFEKPTTYVSSTAIPGLYFLDENSIDMAKALEASDRGELEIIDLLKHYWSRNQLEIQLLPIGTGWLDAGTSESLFMSGEYIRVMQNRHGVSILCPEEIAYRNGWITDSALRNSIPSTISSEYDRYLKALIDE